MNDTVWVGIDGNAGFRINGDNGDSIEVTHDGTNWFIIGSGGGSGDDIKADTGDASVKIVDLNTPATLQEGSSISFEWKDGLGAGDTLTISATGIGLDSSDVMTIVRDSIFWRIVTTAGENYNLGRSDTSTSVRFRDGLDAVIGDSSGVDTFSVAVDASDFSGFGTTDYDTDNDIDVDTVALNSGFKIATSSVADSAQNVDTTTATAVALIEKVADVSGGMFTGNTETNITVTYQDADNTVDLAVDVPVSDSGAATAVTADSALAMHDGGLDSLDFNDPQVTEYVKDHAGALTTAGTKSGIAVAYDDPNAQIDYAILVDNSTIEVQGGSNDLAIVDQGITGNQVDSTSENFAFDGAYHVTSAEPDSAYVTANTINDTAQVLRSKIRDTVMAVVDTFTIQFNYWNPDLITDTMPVFEADSVDYPNGITILFLSCLTSVDGAYALKFFSYTAADPPVLHDYIDTLNVGATDQRASSETFEDADANDIDIGQFIYMLTPSTDIDWIHVKIRALKL
jgi:hypothetical protein